MASTQSNSRVPSRDAKSGSFSILFAMLLVVAGAFIASGGTTPVDPNGPAGPPTLPPDFDIKDYPEQKIIIQKDAQLQDNNLQLKTFNVSHCGENAAMIFLIDTSGSMGYAGKMKNTQTALKYFTSKIGGKTVVGMYTFSDIVKEAVPIGYYKDLKKEVNGTIAGLKPRGFTRTRDGLALLNDQIGALVREKAYPGYSYSVIILTDGVPEIPAPRTCIKEANDPNTAPDKRCFAREQDPRYPTNIATDLKRQGVSIYSVNIYSPDYPSDVIMFPELEKLLKDMASQPTNTHYYSSVNGGNLSKILESVVTNICDDRKK